MPLNKVKGFEAIGPKYKKCSEMCLKLSYLKRQITAFRLLVVVAFSSKGTTYVKWGVISKIEVTDNINFEFPIHQATCTGNVIV